MKRPEPAIHSNTGDLFDEAFLKKLEYLHIVSRRVFSGRNRAERRTRRVGSGIEFADYRDYAPGDDLRYLDWNIYSRMDKLVLRLFEEEEDLHIYLLMDISESMTLGSPPKVACAMQLAAALSYVGLANLDRVSVVTLADGLVERLAPARGKGRIFKIFDFLRATRPGGRTNLGTAIRAFVHQNKQRGLAVVLSDFYDAAGFQEGLNLLRYNRFETLCIHVLDEAEARPELLGDLDLVDCETGEMRQVTVSPSVQRAFAAAHRQFCDELRAYCVSRQVPLFTARTQVPFDEQMLELFRQGGFLR